MSIPVLKLQLVGWEHQEKQVGRWEDVNVQAGSLQGLESASLQFPHWTGVKTECQRKTGPEAKPSKDRNPGPLRSSVGFFKAAGTR